MRRLILSAAVALLAFSSAAGMVGTARADTRKCVDDVSYVRYVCVETKNHDGIDEDQHTITVTMYEEIPMFGLGADPEVTCDDNGGTTPAVITANAGPDMPITLPAQCPDLP